MSRPPINKVVVKNMQIKSCSYIAISRVGAITIASFGYLIRISKVSASDLPDPFLLLTIKFLGESKFYKIYC